MKGCFRRWTAVPGLVTSAVMARFTDDGAQGDRIMEDTMALGRHLAVALLVTLMLLVTTAIAQTEYEQLRLPALRLLGAQIDVGQQEAARDSLRAYLDRYPRDAVMQYNLACMVALDGDLEQALERLDIALAAGYRDVHRLVRDPDLNDLHDDPRLHAILDSLKANGRATMLDRQFDLTEGEWSDWRPLFLDAPGAVPGPEDAQARVRYDVESLIVDFTLPTGGADEVFFTVSAPHNLQDFETSRWSEFQARLDGDGSLARTARDGRRRPLAAAGRLARTDDGWRLTLPWRALHPDRPPVELFFGLNLTLRRDGPAPRPRWSLVRDPFVGSAIHDRRAYLPAALDPGWTPAQLVTGRLERYFVVGDTLSVELGQQGLPGGNYTYRWHVRAGDAALDTTVVIAGDADLSYMTQPLDLRALPRGWFDLSASITTPDGRHFTWQDRGFRLSPDWFLERRDVLEEVPAAERAALQYHLFRVLRNQDQVQPDDDPTPLADAVQAVDRLLERWRRTGHLLAMDAGVQEAAFPVTSTSLQPCQLVMPPQGRRTGCPVVVAVTDDPALSDTLATYLADGADPERPVVYVVIATSDDSGDVNAAASVILAAAGWARQLVASNELHLAAVGTSADLGLRALALAPESWQSALLVAGPAFNPWVLGSPDTNARLLGLALADLPVFLVMPPEPSPSSSALAAAMQAHVAGISIVRRDQALETPAVWADRILARPFGR